MQHLEVSGVLRQIYIYIYIYIYVIRRLKVNMLLTVYREISFVLQGLVSKNVKNYFT